MFSLLAVGAITIMNQGTATAQKALEITLVRQQIDAQAEAIRYIHSAYMSSLGTGDTDSPVVADWRTMTTLSTGNAVIPASISRFDTAEAGKCPALPDNKQAFILNAHSGKLVTDKIPKSANDSPLPYSQVVYSPSDAMVYVESAGIWVEAARTSNVSNFVDFHIRACWYAPGNGPATTIGTIVRLYAPAS